MGNHPARPIIGSINPCFFWDYPPASYIGMVLCSTNVYWTWRYAVMDSYRTSLLNGDSPTPAQRFTKFASYGLGAASNLWLLLWLIGPADQRPKPLGDGHYTVPLSSILVNPDRPGDFAPPLVGKWALHTVFFMFYAVMSYLTYLGSYLEC